MADQNGRQTANIEGNNKNHSFFIYYITAWASSGWLGLPVHTKRQIDLNM